MAGLMVARISRRGCAQSARHSRRLPWYWRLAREVPIALSSARRHHISIADEKGIRRRAPGRVGGGMASSQRHELPGWQFVVAGEKVAGLNGHHRNI